jgi:hypothetical protein
MRAHAHARRALAHDSVVLVISFLVGREIVLGLTPAQAGLMVISLLVAGITEADGGRRGTDPGVAGHRPCYGMRYIGFGSLKVVSAKPPSRSLHWSPMLTTM